MLASKIGNAMGQGPNQAHYSRQWLVRGVEASLARLDTDFLDILYLHRDYHEENLEEAVWALGDLIRAGKLRGFGLSNFRGWRIAEVIRLCAQLGVPQPVVCQPYYNMLNRGPEVEILPACGHYGLGVVPYSPIARGVLTGKYLPGQAPGRHARRSWRPPHPGHRVPRGIAADRAAAGRACRRARVQPGPSPPPALANPLVSSVIAGPRTLAQMQDYYAALDLRITPEDETLVDDGSRRVTLPPTATTIPTIRSTAGRSPHLTPPRPISHAHSADTRPANSTYRQISQGWPPPLLSRAVAMMGVMPEAKMPEN